MSVYEKGITTRAPAVALLCVSSSDQEVFDKQSGFLVSDTLPNQIFINNQKPLIVGFCTRLSLTEIALQYDTPNVNAFNNTLTIGITNNAGTLVDVKRITIPVDFYTAPRLGLEVAKRLNIDLSGTILGPNNFEVVYAGNLCGKNPSVANQTRKGDGTHYVINSISNAGKFFIAPGNHFYSASIRPVEDDLTNLMGITPSGRALAQYKTLQGGYASLQYTPFLDITSTLLTKNQSLKDASTEKNNRTTSILARVYLSNEDFQIRETTVTYNVVGDFIGSTDNAIGTQPGTLRREFVYPKQIQWNNTENIDIIDIQIVDAKGRNLFYKQQVQNLGADTVQINNTADVFLSIQCTES